MSWIDIGVGSGSGSGSSSSHFLGGFINFLGNALSNASSSGGSSSSYPKKTAIYNTLIFRDYQNLFSYLDQQNANANQKLQNAFKRILEIERRLNQLNQEIHHTQAYLNHLNHEINNLNNQIDQSNQALNNLNHEIAGLNHEISANESALNQEQEKLNALELQTNAKKEIAESLKQLEKLKQELKRLKKQSKWKKEFNFLTDNPPNIQAKQESALNRASNKNALMNFFLTDPYAILPKGFIYEYHNPGKETYNALNAPNNMDGINNQFKINALNQVLDNSYQKFLAGNDSYNALGDMEQVKALKFYDLVLNFNLASDKIESALFFKQISQYAKGLKLKILTAPISQKDSKRLKKLENTLKQEERLKGKDLNTLKQEEERLKGKDLNTLMKEIEKEQENALKLKESIKTIQNHTETLKNALNQKEQAKNPIIQEQKQNLERQKNEKEREKQNQQSAKWQKEQEKQNLNNEINSIGNERVTIKKQTGFFYPQIDGGLRATIIEKNQSVQEYYHNQKRIYDLLGFFSFEVLNRREQLYKRIKELTPEQQKELFELFL
ncbi:UV radiation resistance protein [Helicobacter pylori]|uniref:UV radiation resistance protein n=1 Tax=Helicobacter pylori TaxID=210 RepID=UPI0005734495|nr:UV radiation resistance protein [Helicobacter pylori]ANT42570.1 exonuclease [Helicobacter phage Pt1846U]KHL83683.1 UV radiation resistance protein [Helicobacter pylori]MCQ2823340.1 UV radiation resistance protein [Helicobacter pylori]